MATIDTQPAFSKYIKFDLNTGAIIDKATEYLKPEKLTVLLEEHESLSPPKHLTLAHRTNRRVHRRRPLADLLSPLLAILPLLSLT